MDIVINIPSHISDDEKLKDWILENSEEFWGAMDLDASQYDDRATIDEVNILDVEISKAMVVIHYQYEYSAYYGCKDMDNSDIADEDSVIGERQGNTLVFKKFKPREPRSTYEEF